MGWPRVPGVSEQRHRPCPSAPWAERCPGYQDAWVLSTVALIGDLGHIMYLLHALVSSSLKRGCQLDIMQCCCGDPQGLLNTAPGTKVRVSIHCSSTQQICVEHWLHRGTVDDIGEILMAQREKIAILGGLTHSGGNTMMVHRGSHTNSSPAIWKNMALGENANPWVPSPDLYHPS